jgi:hypothetical protein
MDNRAREVGLAVLDRDHLTVSIDAKDEIGISFFS